MKPAREAAHAHEGEGCHQNDLHWDGCDRLTAVFEARDEEWNRDINANDRDWEAKIARLSREVAAMRLALAWWIEHAGDAFPLHAKEHTAAFALTPQDPGK